MTALYATVLALGVIALLVWIAAVAVAASVEGWERADPERRFGPRGRVLVAAATGFGLGGMSSTFAGWNEVTALGAAIAGAIAIAAAARFAGPTSPRGS